MPHTNQRNLRQKSHVRQLLSSGSATAIGGLNPLRILAAFRREWWRALIPSGPLMFHETGCGDLLCQISHRPITGGLALPLAAVSDRRERLMGAAAQALHYLPHKPHRVPEVPNWVVREAVS